MVVRKLHDNTTTDVGHRMTIDAAFLEPAYARIEPIEARTGGTKIARRACGTTGAAYGAVGVAGTTRQPCRRDAHTQSDESSTITPTNIRARYECNV